MVEEFLFLYKLSLMFVFFFFLFDFILFILFSELGHKLLHFVSGAFRYLNSIFVTLDKSGIALKSITLNSSQINRKVSFFALKRVFLKLWHRFTAFEHFLKNLSVLFQFDISSFVQTWWNKSPVFRLCIEKCLQRLGVKLEIYLLH